MDLDLSPEHALLRDTVRDFALREVEPVIEEHEKARRFPAETVRKLGPMGLMGVPYPEDEGGAGLDTPAATKRALARAAKAAGRSEAELIRRGIELVVSSVAPEPRLPLFDSAQPDLADRTEEMLAGFGER